MLCGPNRSLRAAFGLVTVPSGVLAELHPESQIRFDPPLPEEKMCLGHVHSQVHGCVLQSLWLGKRVGPQSKKRQKVRFPLGVPEGCDISDQH